MRWCFLDVVRACDVRARGWRATIQLLPAGRSDWARSDGRKTRHAHRRAANSITRRLGCFRTDRRTRARGGEGLLTTHDTHETNTSVRLRTTVRGGPARSVSPARVHVGALGRISPVASDALQPSGARQHGDPLTDSGACMSFYVCFFSLIFLSLRVVGGVASRVPLTMSTLDASAVSGHSAAPSSIDPSALVVPPNFNLFLCRHGERVDQVFGLDWIEQAFRTHKLHGAAEREERARVEAAAERHKKREARRAARAEVRRHSVDRDLSESGDSSSDDVDPSPYQFSFSAHRHGADAALHHASYVRFNLNMPKDHPSRLPRRDITHYAEDAPLTECGHWQAGLVGEALQGANIQYVYASPALRCIQTAQEICQALGLVAAPHPYFPHGTASPAFSPTPPPATATTAAASSLIIPTPFAPTSPPSFGGIRIEYGLFEWMGWYTKYPHWLSARDLQHAGLCVDATYSPCSLRPKQGETQREWYERSTDTMQRILHRHFGTAGTTPPRSGHTSAANSRRSSAQHHPAVPHVNLPASARGNGGSSVGASTTSGTPLLYAHGNILFVAHAGSLDTLSYGLLHSSASSHPHELGGIPPQLSPAARAPSQEELAQGKRMRLFSNYCGIARIQYVTDATRTNPNAPSAAAAAADATHASQPFANGAPTWAASVDSRRNSFSRVTSGSAGVGHWQIADDSPYDMTNSSNDPFSFQLSYASYQKTMAHMFTTTITLPSSNGPVMHSPQSVAALTEMAKQAREAHEAAGDDDSGADAIVLSMPPVNGTSSPSSSITTAVVYPPRAHVALPAERTPDLNFRASFGPLLDACNGLANFLLTLTEKQKEKLGQVQVASPPPSTSERATGLGLRRYHQQTATSVLPPDAIATLSPTRHRASRSHGALTTPRSSSGSDAVMLLHGGNANGGSGGALLPTLRGVASPSVASSPLSVLDSWLLLAIQKTSARVVSSLPEWGSLRVGVGADLVPLHVFRLMVALRRFVVPLRRWTRLPRSDKNLISWLCLLHHIAPPECACASSRVGVVRSGASSASSSTTSSLSLRCDFLCALSSCVVAARILTRQGFMRKAAATAGDAASAYASSEAARELRTWTKKAEALRAELKAARDRAHDANEEEAEHTDTASTTTGRANNVRSHSSRPSTPPPSRLPARSDGWPHAYDLVELVDGLPPICGTDVFCADLLRAVLLAPLITGLVRSERERDEERQRIARERERDAAAQRATANSTPVTHTQATQTPMPPAVARYAHVLMTNSAHEYTTSLTSSSSLPLGAAPTPDPTPASEELPVGFGSARRFPVPSSLLALLPSLLTPRLFDALYLFAVAHVSAAELTRPAAQVQAVTELQQCVDDLRAAWRERDEQQQQQQRQRREEAEHTREETKSTADAP